MTLGSFQIPFVDVARPSSVMGRTTQVFVVRSLRLPRVLCAILIGATLAMSGAIFQGLVRNPLVSPDIIGINAGASAVAVFWIVTDQSPALPAAGRLRRRDRDGGAIYLLSWKGGIVANRLILVGIGIGAALGGADDLLHACATRSRPLRPAMSGRWARSTAATGAMSAGCG